MSPKPSAVPVPGTVLRSHRHHRHAKTGSSKLRLQYGTSHRQKPRGAGKGYLPFVLWADSPRRVKPFSSLIFPPEFSSDHGEKKKKP